MIWGPKGISGKVSEERTAEMSGDGRTFKAEEQRT